MKAGQMLSVVDLDAVPPAYREEVRTTLAELRDSAPTVSFSDMRKVLERDYGEKLERVFATFDEVPVAAASIGQVYRATLDDGREVAVKVQYPGIDAAVRADLQNLVPLLRDRQADRPEPRRRGPGRRGPRPHPRGARLRAGGRRTRARSARAHRGHPFIVIPGVVTDLCRTHVIVMDFVRGASPRGDRAPRPGHARPRRRDDLPLLLRRDVPPPRVLRRPAPGQLDAARRRPDGVPGLRPVQAASPRGPPSASWRSSGMGVEGRGEDMIERMRDAGMLPDSSRATPESILDQFRRYTWWYTTDEIVELDPGDGDADRAGLLRPAARRVPRGAPRDAARRARLRPPAGDDDAGGHEPAAPARQLVPVAREWLYGDAPHTELGKLEAAYYAGRR